MSVSHANAVHSRVAKHVSAHEASSLRSMGLTERDVTPGEQQPRSQARSYARPPTCLPARPPALPDCMHCLPVHPTIRPPVSLPSCPPTAHTLHLHVCLQAAPAPTVHSLCTVCAQCVHVCVCVHRGGGGGYRPASHPWRPCLPSAPFFSWCHLCASCNMAT